MLYYRSFQTLTRQKKLFQSSCLNNLPTSSNSYHLALSKYSFKGSHHFYHHFYTIYQIAMRSFQTFTLQQPSLLPPFLYNFHHLSISINRSINSSHHFYTISIQSTRLPCDHSKGLLYSSHHIYHRFYTTSPFLSISVHHLKCNSITAIASITASIQSNNMHCRSLQIGTRQQHDSVSHIVLISSIDAIVYSITDIISITVIIQSHILHKSVIRNLFHIPTH